MSSKKRKGPAEAGATPSAEAGADRDAAGKERETREGAGRASMLFKRAGGQGFWFGPISKKSLPETSSKIAKRLGFAPGTDLRLVHVREGGREAEIWDDHDLEALRSRALANPAQLMEIKVYPAAGPSSSARATPNAPPSAFRTPVHTARNAMATSAITGSSESGLTESPPTPQTPSDRHRMRAEERKAKKEQEKGRRSAPVGSANPEGKSGAKDKGQAVGERESAVSGKARSAADSLRAVGEPSSEDQHTPSTTNTPADHDSKVDPLKSPTTASAKKARKREKKAEKKRRHAEAARQSEQVALTNTVPPFQTVSTGSHSNKRKRSSSPSPNGTPTKDAASPARSNLTDESPRKIRRKKKRDASDAGAPAIPGQGIIRDATSQSTASAPQQDTTTSIPAARPLAALKERYRPVRPSPLGRTSTSAIPIGQSVSVDAAIESVPVAQNSVQLQTTIDAAPAAVQRAVQDPAITHAKPPKLPRAARKRKSSLPSEDVSLVLPIASDDGSSLSNPKPSTGAAQVASDKANSISTSAEAGPSDAVTTPSTTNAVPPAQSDPVTATSTKKAASNKKKRATSTASSTSTPIESEPSNPAPVDSAENTPKEKKTKPKARARAPSMSETSQSAMGILARYRQMKAAEAAAASTAIATNTTPPSVNSVSTAGRSADIAAASLSAGPAEHAGAKPVGAKKAGKGKGAVPSASKGGKEAAGAVIGAAANDKATVQEKSTPASSEPTDPPAVAKGRSKAKKSSAAATSAVKAIAPSAGGHHTPGSSNAHHDAGQILEAPDIADADALEPAGKLLSPTAPDGAGIDTHSAESSVAASTGLSAIKEGIAASTAPTFAVEPEIAETAAPTPVAVSDPEPVAPASTSGPARKPNSKRRSASIVPESKLPCIVCGEHPSPMHMQLDCPVVLAGLPALETRLAEVKAMPKSRDKALAVDALEGWIKRLRTREEKRRVLRAVQGLPDEVVETAIKQAGSNVPDAVRANVPDTSTTEHSDAPAAMPVEELDQAARVEVDRTSTHNGIVDDPLDGSGTPDPEEAAYLATPARSAPRTPVTYSRAKPTPRRKSTSSASSASSSSSTSAHSDSDTSASSAHAEQPKTATTDASLPAIFLRGLKPRKRPGSISAVSASTALIETEASESGSASGSNSSSTSSSDTGRSRSASPTESASGAQDSRADTDNADEDEDEAMDGTDEEDNVSETTSGAIGRLASSSDLSRLAKVPAAGMPNGSFSPAPRPSPGPAVRLQRAAQAGSPGDESDSGTSSGSDSGSDSDTESTPPDIPSPSMHRAALPFANEESLPDPEALFQQYFTRPLSQREQAQVAASAQSMGNVSLRPVSAQEDDGDESESVHSSSDGLAATTNAGARAGADDTSSIGDFGSAAEDQAMISDQEDEGLTRTPTLVPPTLAPADPADPDGEADDDEIASDQTSVPPADHPMGAPVEPADQIDNNTSDESMPNGHAAVVPAPSQGRSAPSPLPTSQRSRRSRTSSASVEPPHTRSGTDRQSARFRRLDSVGESEVIDDFEGAVALAQARAEEATPEPLRLSQRSEADSGTANDGAADGQDTSTPKPRAKGRAPSHHPTVNGSSRPTSTQEIDLPPTSQGTRRSSRLRSSELEVVIPTSQRSRRTSSQTSQASPHASQTTPKAPLHVLIEESDELRPAAKLQRSSQVDQLLSTPPQSPTASQAPSLVITAPSTPQRQSRISASPTPATSRRSARKAAASPSPAPSTRSTRSAHQSAPSEEPPSPLFMPQSQPLETQAYHLQRQSQSLDRSSPAIARGRRGHKGKAPTSPIAEQDEEEEDQGTPRLGESLARRNGHALGELSSRSPSSRASSSSPNPPALSRNVNGHSTSASDGETDAGAAAIAAEEVEDEVGVDEDEEEEEEGDDASSQFPFPALVLTPLAFPKAHRPEPPLTSFAPSLSSLPMDLLRSGVSAFANFAGLSASQPLPSRPGAANANANAQASARQSYSQDSAAVNGRRRADELASDSESSTGSESSSDSDAYAEGKGKGASGSKVKNGPAGAAGLKGRYVPSGKKKVVSTRGKAVGW